ncbi:hypothetical protein Tco_0730195 [Tanacetum coccineum]|uniref:Uncharacterized protein n=1 Tax=Tanacetum coccineum TaxID=301880 RepID=A0ABQ4YR37_9ASTR
MNTLLFFFLPVFFFSKISGRFSHNPLHEWLGDLLAAFSLLLALVKLIRFTYSNATLDSSDNITYAIGGSALFFPELLPSIPSQNPRCEARAITTRSGLSYTPVPPIPPPLYDENEPLIEKETEVTKDKVLPSTKDIQPPVIQKSHDPVKPVSSPISPEPSSVKEEYEKKGENDKVQIQKFWEMFKKIHVDITLADALILMPKYQKMLKRVVIKIIKVKREWLMLRGVKFVAIILQNFEKLGDPDIFSISCLPALQLPGMTLELANCSLCVPKGIAEMFWFSGFWKGFHGSKLWKDKAMPTISIDDLQSSLHNVVNLLSLSLSN